MAGNKRWIEAEEEYLIENWGLCCINDLRLKLNKKFKSKRTFESIRKKVDRLGLGSISQAQNNISVLEITKIMKVDTHTVHNWVQNKGLSSKKIYSKNNDRHKVIIQFSDLLDWLRNNLTLWDSRKVEIYALGSEPDWLRMKRKSDIHLITRRQWTTAEKERAYLLFMQCRTNKDIAKILNRTYRSVKNCIYTLKQEKINKAKGA